jgi:enoyl-CoA hydratase/carnithine racemase
MKERDYQTIRTEIVNQHVLVLTLNRPEVSNAVNTQMGKETLEVWSELAGHAGDIRAVVLTGAGERVFCAGGDLKERNGMSKEQWETQHEIFEKKRWAMMECPVPIIGAANGHAYAGGLEQLLTCDFIYASRAARFALTEVTLGIMPGSGGTQLLPRAVGPRRAKEIIMRGKPFSAEEAYEWGLVNRLCDPQSVVSDAVATATEIATNAPLSIRQVKKSIDYGMNMDVKSALIYEIEAYNRLVVTEDRVEGVRAYNEKRKPVFKGR